MNYELTIKEKIFGKSKSVRNDDDFLKVLKKSHADINRSNMDGVIKAIGQDARANVKPEGYIVFSVIDPERSSTEHRYEVVTAHSELLCRSIHLLGAVPIVTTGTGIVWHIGHDSRSRMTDFAAERLSMCFPPNTKREDIDSALVPYLAGPFEALPWGTEEVAR